jgi:hypothetical protein
MVPLPLVSERATGAVVTAGAGVAGVLDLAGAETGTNFLRKAMIDTPVKAAYFSKPNIQCYIEHGIMEALIALLPYSHILLSISPLTCGR